MYVQQTNFERSMGFYRIAADDVVKAIDSNVLARADYRIGALFENFGALISNAELDETVDPARQSRMALAMAALADAGLHVPGWYAAELSRARGAEFHSKPVPAWSPVNELAVVLPPFRGIGV